MANTPTLRKQQSKPAASGADRPASHLRPQNRKLLKWLDSWLVTPDDRGEKQVARTSHPATNLWRGHAVQCPRPLIRHRQSQEPEARRTEGQPVRLLTGSTPRTLKSMTALLTPANPTMLDACNQEAADIGKHDALRGCSRLSFSSGSLREL